MQQQEKETKDEIKGLTKEQLFQKAREEGYKGQESVSEIGEFLIEKIGLCPVYYKETDSYFLEPWH